MMATEIRGLTQSSDAALQPVVIPDERESAYYLWAHVHEQNARDVGRALAINDNTIRSWANRDGWRARYQQERGELADRVRSTVEVALLRAIPDGVASMARIVRGEGDLRKHVTKDGEVIEVEEFVPYAARVNAFKELKAMFEGPPTQRHTHQLTTTDPASTPPTPATSTQPDPFDPHVTLTREQAAALTPEQRRQLEQALRSRS